MTLSETFQSVFSPKEGSLSSGRIGHHIGLWAIVIYTGYDAYVNKKLDPVLAGLLLSSGTVGYGISTSASGKTVSLTQGETDVKLPE